MHRLEHLENEGITGRSRFNTMGEGGVNDIDKEGWGK